MIGYAVGVNVYDLDDPVAPPTTGARDDTRPSCTHPRASTSIHERPRVALVGRGAPRAIGIHRRVVRIRDDHLVAEPPADALVCADPGRCAPWWLASPCAPPRQRVSAWIVVGDACLHETAEDQPPLHTNYRAVLNACSRVVLPDPLSPTTASNSPGRSPMLTPRKAVTPSYA